MVASLAKIIKDITEFAEFLVDFTSRTIEKVGDTSALGTIKRLTEGWVIFKNIIEIVGGDAGVFKL